VVEHEIDPRPRGERGEVLEQHERLEHEMARAVRPCRLEREHDAAIGQQPESIPSDRGAEQITAELLQARAIRRRLRDVGVEIEAREMRVPGNGREPPRRVGIIPQAPHPAARARSERESPLDRGAADAGQSGGFFDHRVRRGQIAIAGIEAAALEQTPHPLGDPREHDADLVVGRRGQRTEIECPLLAFEEDAIEEQRVEMQVQIQSAPKALDDGHASRPPVSDPVSARVVALEAQ
jgi:hypothetical protein